MEHAKRKRKTIEAEKSRNLAKDGGRLSAPPTPSNGHESLRRAMFQQLGIIKMVAETPAEQNREMLGKISSIDGDTSRSTCQLKNVYEIIDNLYSGFLLLLHEEVWKSADRKRRADHGPYDSPDSRLKKSSVITSQTTATIYVRKSSVRKKAQVPERRIS